MKNKIRVLPVFFAMLTMCSLYAQKQYEDKDFSQGVLVRTMPDGKDSVCTNVKIYNGGKEYDKQNSVVYKDSLAGIITLTPQEVSSYRIVHQKLRQSHEYIKEDGTIGKVFLARPTIKDSLRPKIYKVYSTPKKYQRYMGVSNEKLVAVMKKDDPSYGNKLIEYLEEQNRIYGGNSEIAKYVQTVHPSRYSISRRYSVVKSQNTNRLPVFRWGVGTGVNLNMLSFRNPEYKFEMDTQAQWQAQLFADYRTAFGIGLHAELSFLKASSKMSSEPIEGNNILYLAYNKTAITLPVMLRHTFTSLRGKWLPFIDAGVQLRYDFKDQCYEYRLYETLADNTLYHYTYENKGISLSFVGGIGIEYRVTPKHSLFFEGRYSFQNVPRLIENNFVMPVNSLMFNLSYSL